MRVVATMSGTQSCNNNTRAESCCDSCSGVAVLMLGRYMCSLVPVKQCYHGKVIISWKCIRISIEMACWENNYTLIKKGIIVNEKGIKMEWKWEKDVQKIIGRVLQRCQFEHLSLSLLSKTWLIHYSCWRSKGIKINNFFLLTYKSSKDGW